MKAKLFQIFAIISLLLVPIFVGISFVEAYKHNVYTGFNAFDYLQCAFAATGFFFAFRHFQKQASK